MSEPKYRPNQVVRILHDWAKDIPPRPIEDVAWDECWNCYTYAFPWALIRIEEHELEATDQPDMTPDEWAAQRKAALTATSQPAPPYKEWCRHPEECAGLASCPRNPTCAD